MKEIKIIKAPDFHDAPNWVQNAWIGKILHVDENHLQSNGQTYAVAICNATHTLCTSSTIFQLKYWEQWQQETPDETHFIFPKECCEIL